MDILAWIIVGALAGWIASMIMGTNGEQGALTNIVVGIVGALIGGFVVGMLSGSDTVTGFNLSTLLTATLGAVILLAIVRAFRSPRATV